MRANLLLIVAVSALGCGGQAAYPPRISAIVPAEGANDLDVPVEISGEHFEARIQTDFVDPTHSG